MAERPWEWELPTGEKLVAKVDSSGVESVYLGSHLVSRSARGLKATGHEIRGHDGADGAYRGAKDMRVFFEDEGCRLVIDGETMKRAPPPPPPSDAAPPGEHAGRSQSMPTPIALGVLAFLVVVLLVIMSKTGSRHREAAPAPARAAERLPNTQAQRSSNGLVTVHFPTSFIVKESTTRPDGSIVVLDAKEGYETISFYSWATPDATDVWKLDALWHASDVRSWERAGTRFVGEERRTDGKCHGEDAAIVVRHASTKDGTNVRVWTCAFLHDHHAFRFVTFTLEAVTPDDAYLNSILDAAEL